MWQCFAWKWLVGTLCVDSTDPFSNETHAGACDLLQAHAGGELHKRESAAGPMMHEHAMRSRNSGFLQQTVQSRHTPGQSRV
jgi:hypothetical protein